MKQLRTRHEMEKMIEAAAYPDKDFVNAILKAMKNLGTKNLGRCMDAMANGKYAEAAAILGKDKKGKKVTEAKNLLDDQRFVKAILQALEGADPKIISGVFNAFSKGDNATAGKLLASIKKKDFS